MVAFDDRVDAGRQLAERLESFRGENTVVLGLPRGGVPVAYEVAVALGAPLDVIMVRKLGAPRQPELALGAIGEGGVRVLDRRLVAMVGATEDDVRRVEAREAGILADRVALLRRGRPAVDLLGRTALIVDDGIATGSTARVACHVAREHGAARVVLAVPVAPPDTVRSFEEADEVIALATPANFLAVGNHYRDFSAATDEDVIALLDAAAARPAGQDHSASGERDASHADPDPGSSGVDVDVEIPARGVVLGAHLTLPPATTGIVLFAHGSGSSRHSPRNQYVASVLTRGGVGTLLLDLLTPQEERDRSNVFDIPLLARRLLEATRWLARRSDTRGARLGYFGASTGAGAALYAASEAGSLVSAIVSRGGRPDLAGPRVAMVTAPTLLIVGSRDPVVLDLNRRAQSQMHCPSDLRIVKGATHLFEEPGTLTEVAELSRDWFDRYLLHAVSDVPAHGRMG